MEEGNGNNGNGRRNAFLRTRDLWIDYVNQHHALSHATARIGIFIALRMTSKKPTTQWTVQKLAKTLHVSTKTVTDATLILERMGLMNVRRSKRLGNEYSIRLPAKLDTF
jgi:DNA-binding MarR family transcriptional regulator